MNTKIKKCVLFMDDQLDLIAHYITRIEIDGYDVVAVSSASDARRIFSRQMVDVAILDANLLPSTEIARIKDAQRSVGDEPYVEEEGLGFRVAAWIREYHQQTGVIVLSSERTEPSDRINGLDCGADDYATKGMTADELSSRVKALLRRLSPELKSINFGDLSLSIDHGQLCSRSGMQVLLTTSEARLLKALAARPIKAKARSELYMEVFDAEIPSLEDRAIDNLISKIRRKTRESLGLELPVDTIYGGGYLLIA